jgi:hypothetical protein
MDKSKKQDSQDQSTDKTHTNRALISDCVSPYIEPIYELLIDDFIDKYKIKLPLSFWFIFSLFIFSVVTIYFKLNYEGAFFLFLLALVILLANNRKLIANIITKKILYDKGKVVDEFISNINNKNLHETKRFILNNYHELSSNDLILLLQSKFFNTPSLHLSILKSQIIDSELLEYMISNNFEVNIGVDIFCDYLKYCSNSISLTAYETLIKRNTDKPKIIKTANACFPFFLTTHGFFKFFANFRISLKESINYGKLRGIIFVGWFILGLWAIIGSQPSYIRSFINQTQITTGDPMTQTFFSVMSYINLFMSFFITAFILSVVTLYVISWLSRRYRTLLCIVAPT